MHQYLMCARKVAIVYEEILFNIQRWIASLKIACTIVFYAMSQYQILRTRRGANRVSLHEPQFFDGASERGRCKKGSGDGIASQVV